MATWSGWQTEFLTAAQVQNTADNRRFLSEWASNANTNCKNNPVDLTASVAKSTNCHSLPSITAKAQNYTSHGNAAHAFYVQTHRSGQTALLAALKSGNPYTVDNTGNVAQDLSSWGSQTFAQIYFAETAGQRGGGGGTDNYAPHTTKAWGDLRHQVNQTMPTTLRRVGRLQTATSTALRRHRRVRH